MPTRPSALWLASGGSSSLASIMKTMAVLVGLAVAASVQPAMAQLGVAMAVDGTPTSQGPAAAERRLKMGTQLQAGERITTGPGDRVYLVFQDGTALTVGADSAMTI